jgi:hypothetical protein
MGRVRMVIWQFSDVTIAAMGMMVAHRAAGERVRAFAETLHDFVAAPLAQGLRDQKNFILRQRFASRFRHPHTFEHDRFKLKRSCSFFYRRRARRHKGLIDLAHAPRNRFPAR